MATWLLSIFVRFATLEVNHLTVTVHSVGQVMDTEDVASNL